MALPFRLFLPSDVRQAICPRDLRPDRGTSGQLLFLCESPLLVRGPIATQFAESMVPILEGDRRLSRPPPTGVGRPTSCCRLFCGLLRQCRSATIPYGRPNSGFLGASFRVRLRIRKTRGTLWQRWRSALSMWSIVDLWLPGPEYATSRASTKRVEPGKHW